MTYLFLFGVKEGVLVEHHCAGQSTSKLAERENVSEPFRNAKKQQLQAFRDRQTANGDDDKDQRSEEHHV